MKLCLAQVSSAATAATATTARTATQATTAGTAAPSGAASGGLTGTNPGPSIAANAVGSSNVLDASQATGLRKADLAAVVATVTFDPPHILANGCGTATTSSRSTRTRT